MNPKSFFPCAGGRALHAPTRRDFVFGLGASLGSVVLTSLLAKAGAEEKPSEKQPSAGPLAPKPQQVPAKAKNCIFLMMEGGPSHIDTFDPKPSSPTLHLQEFVREGKTKSAMESGKRYYVQSPFKFHKAGQLGRRHGRELAAPGQGGRRAVLLPRLPGRQRQPSHGHVPDELRQPLRRRSRLSARG